ncbi:putative ribonuclease H-like domain-containing protein [Tanacetum coccineum]|uniref:Ribonuclease H-like domain-containing protein n=1 Tax=Tanacetum coccineum TaxID=301880 RepID=A0ABQ5BTL7_9ASTR
MTTTQRKKVKEEYLGKVVGGRHTGCRSSWTFLQTASSKLTMKMEILLEPTSNKLMVEHAEFDESNANVLERFYTSAGNPVKEILLKLNLPDHRILKDGGEDFRYSDTERLSRSDEVLKLKNFKKDATLKLSKSTNQEWYEHNGNSKKRISTGKDGVIRILPPVTAAEIQAVEKERKAKNILLMKAVFKQQFEAFKISSLEGLEKGYDRFQQLLSQLEAHGAEVSTEDANYKFLRSFPQHEVIAGFADEVIYSLFAKQSEDWDLLHEDLEQIDDLDIEEMDINWQIAMIAIRMKKFYKKTRRRVRVDGKTPVGFDKKKLECFNCHNSGHFARECTAKGTHDGKKRRDSFYQHQEAGKQEKNQMGLLTMDDGIVNWGEHTEDEETNHALMAISSSKEDSVGKPLYSRFIKTNDFKGVPHPLSGDYTPTPQEEIDESLYVYELWNIPLYHSMVESESEISSILPKVYVSSPITTNERPFAKTTAQMSHSHAVKGNWGSAVKTSAGYNWRNSKPNSNYDSGPTFIRNMNAKGSSTKEHGRKRILDSGCSVHMPETNFLFVSSDFKMPDENQILLKVPRHHNMYSFDMKTPTPAKGFACLIAKATSDESKLWHRRLDTLSVLGKFDGKSDECFLVGYSLNSKAYRVYNLVTKRVEVNLHVNFLEDKPNVKGVGYRWMFNIEYLTDSMNYIPVSLENQANPHAEKEASSTDTSEDNPKILAFRGELEAIAQKHLGTVPENNSTSTLSVNFGSEPVNTGKLDLDDSPMPELEIFHKSETGIFDEASYVEKGVVTDFNSLLTEIEVSPTPTLRIHNIHQKIQILGDPKSAVQTRSKEEPKKIFEALQDNSWVQAMQEELLQFKLQQEEGINYDEVFAPVARIKAIRLFFTFASFMGFIVYQMDVKSAFVYGTIDEEVYVSQPPGFVDPDHPKKVYKVVKALYGLHQAPRALYATLSTFLEKHGYKRGTIDKTLFIKRDKKDIMLVQVYVDDIIFRSTKKSWCDEFEALMKSRFQMSSMGELTFFLGLQVKQNKEGIFISQDKESPFDLEAFSDSDYGGSNLDRKSTTGGCQFLGQRLISWQCKKQTIVATSTTEAEYVAAANCCGQVLWVQNQLLDYGFNFMNTKIHIDNESTICIVKNPVYHSKTKHIEIRHHFIRDCYEKKLIRVEKIHTDLNVADLLTKPFDGPRNSMDLQMYALTTNPTIHDSLVKQFWQTATAKTLADGTLELHATIDTIAYTITEASIRRQEVPFVTQPQPSSSVVPPTPPTTQPIPSKATTIPPLSQPAPPTPIAETTTASPSPSPTPAHEPMEHTFEQPSSDQQPPSPRQEATTSQLKTLEVALKRKTKRVLLSNSEEEETEAQGRKTHDLDPLVSLVQELVTPSNTVNASGEEQVEDISPTTLEAAAILIKVKKIKPVDKGKRYKRRKSSKEFAGTGLDFEEVKSAFEKVNTGGIKVSYGIEEINTGSLDVNIGIDPVTTDSIRVLVPSPDKGLVEAIRLNALEKALEKEEVAKQVHLDSLLAQRLAEEQELTEEQKKRKAQVQFEAQSYTEEDWDTIRAKLEVNAELKESVLGKDLTIEDYAKRMVELNQGTWKLTQLKNNKGKFAKKLKFDDEGTQPIEKKIEEDKDDKPTKKTGKRRKQIERKGFHTDHDRDESEDLDEAKEKDDSTSGTKIPINHVPVATKSPSIANYKIIKQGRKGVYQIVRENGTDMVYISFGAMLTDISRDDLTELYRIVMKKHGMNEPEDEFEKVLWEYLKNMFEEPLSTDSIWSLPGQQRIICQRYYDAYRVHCLNLESSDVYMLIERKYPLSAEVCKAMLDKKLQGGKPDEDCYKLLKMIEKQAGIGK